MKLMVVTLAIGLILAGCANEKRSFFQRPRSEWPAQFSKLGPDKKWDYYIYGVRERKPPALELSLEMAKSRGQALDIIINDVEHRTGHQEEISYVLHAMRNDIHYDPCSYEPFYRAVESAHDGILFGERAKCGIK